jgi:hypothetical protein
VLEREEARRRKRKRLGKIKTEAYEKLFKKGREIEDS